MSKYYIIRIKTNVNDFVKNSRVAVGWSDINFSEYNNQDKLIETVKQHYYSGEISPSIRGRKLGEIKRFINIKEGDVIIVPSYKSFYIGYATGCFVYEENSRDLDLSNQLLVNFKKNESNEPIQFSREGKNTALATKLKVRGFTILDVFDEILIKSIDELINSDKDVSDVEKVIRLENRELEKFKNNLKQVLPNYQMTSLSAGGTGFEKLVKALMESDGYKASILSKKCGNGIADADVLAVKESSLDDEFTTACYIQAKHYWGKSENGIQQIIEFKNQKSKDAIVSFTFEDESTVSIKSENIKYILISSGDFCDNVSVEAETNGIILINGEQLAEMLFEKIDELPNIRYQLGFIKKYDHYINQ